MSDVLLLTLNAKYIHAAFGLRYLMANLGPLQERAQMLEFDIHTRPTDMLEAILATDPTIVGIGVYIWNASQSLQLVADLKRLRPETIIIIGGPEVSYEIEQQEICRLADYVVTGEADRAFGKLCECLLGGERPADKVIAAKLPEFEDKAVTRVGSASADGMSLRQMTIPSAKADPTATIALPYELYSAADLAHRVIYVEASRGCPFKCEFCLSSLDVPVRNVPLGVFLEEMQNLLDRGAMRFKFVDRTFNLNLNFSRAILDFFFERYRDGMFLHFEMIPDRLPEGLRQSIARFPAGALQFEVGVQTFNEDASQRISRRQDNAKLEDNLRWLRDHTGVHVHADLIVGLPGEGIESFGRGFDRLLALRPQEIQVGMLKRLRGTPIVRHDAAFGMIYSPNAPYEILQTSSIDFATMQRMRRYARYWDLFGNSGNFVAALPLLWGDVSPFETFLKFSDWLYAELGRNHGIALQELAEHLFVFMTRHIGRDPQEAAQAIWRDYQRCGRSDRPGFLREVIELPIERAAAKRIQSRQSRHRGN